MGGAVWVGVVTVTSLRLVIPQTRPRLRAGFGGFCPTVASTESLVFGLWDRPAGQWGWMGLGQEVKSAQEHQRRGGELESVCACACVGL